jgi:ligand-binding sensor domain-containing protein
MSDGTIWLGTPAGVGRLGTGAPAWFGPSSGLPDPRITALAGPIAPGRSILAGTWRGLAKSGPSGFVADMGVAPITTIAVRGATTVVAVPGQAPACGSDSHPDFGPSFAAALHFATSGKLWAGGDALWACDGSSWTRFAEIPGGVIDIAEGFAGRLWLGTGHGVTWLEGDDLHVVQGPAAAGVTLLSLDSGMLVGTWGDGLWNCGNRGCRRLPGIGPGARVADLARDSANATWVTADGGLYRCGASTCEAFVHPELKAAGDLGPIEADGGVIWVGAPGGGGLVRIASASDVLRYTPDRRLPDADILDVLSVAEDTWLATEAGLVRYSGTQFLPLTGIEPPVFCLAVDGESRLWVGSRTGLSRVQLGTALNDSYVLHIPVLMGGAVRALAIDGKGHIWAGGPDGLVEFDGAMRATNHTPQLPDSSVRDIAVDAVGAVWVATSGGLARWSAGVWRNYTKEDGLPSDVVWAVHCDLKGGLWVGTFGAGAARFDGDRFRHLNYSHGLPSNVVRQILDVDSGDVWILTDTGLVSIAIEGLPDVRPSALAGWLVPGSLLMLLIAALIGWLTWRW